MSISRQKIELFISTQLIQWLNGKRNDRLLILKLVRTYSDWARAGWSLGIYTFWFENVERARCRLWRGKVSEARGSMSYLWCRLRCDWCHSNSVVSETISYISIVLRRLKSKLYVYNAKKCNSDIQNIVWLCRTITYRYFCLNHPTTEFHRLLWTTYKCNTHLLIYKRY